MVIRAAAADKMMPAFIQFGNQLFRVVAFVEYQCNPFFIGHGGIDLLKDLIDQFFHHFGVMLIGGIQPAEQGDSMIAVHRQSQADMP